MPVAVFTATAAGLLPTPSVAGAARDDGNVGQTGRFATARGEPGPVLLCSKTATGYKPGALTFDELIATLSCRALSTVGVTGCPPTCAVTAGLLAVPK